MMDKRGSRRLPGSVGSSSWAHSQASIPEIIESLLARFHDTIDEKRLAVEVDLDISTPNLALGQALLTTFEHLLSMVIDRCPFGGELLITALETEEGLEFEFADSGEGIPLSLEKNRLSAFKPAEVDGEIFNLWPPLARTEQRLDCQVFCTRCPQGGLAWTLVQRRRQAVLKFA